MKRATFKGKIRISQGIVILLLALVAFSQEGSRIAGWFFLGLGAARLEYNWVIHL
jgi:hypothetical protein